MRRRPREGGLRSTRLKLFPITSQVSSSPRFPAPRRRRGWARSRRAAAAAVFILLSGCVRQVRQAGS